MYVWSDHINPSNAEATFALSTKIFENHSNPVMLVFIGKFLLSTLRWVPMCLGFSHFSGLLHHFVYAKVTTISIRVITYAAGSKFDQYKMRQKPEKLKHRHMDNHLRVLCENYPMYINMTGVRWFSKNHCILVLWTKVALPLEGLSWNWIVRKEPKIIPACKQV